MIWPLTKRKVYLAIGIAIVLLILLGVGLASYIQPRTPTDRQALVNIFVVIAAGIVGTLTAIAAVGNLIISRRNLQQQRDLDERRAQDDALQTYYKQMGDLLTEHNLKKAKPDDDVALLGRAQTLTVLRRLDARRKSDLVQFLYGAGLIDKVNKIMNLGGGDLSDAGLSYADLSGADLSGANLIGANLRRAALAVADLRGASVFEQQLFTCQSLEGATMPNGQKYEEWIKDKEGRSKSADNTDRS